MCQQVNKAGWSGNGNNTNMCFAEYGTLNSDGSAYDTSSRTSWGMQLSEADVYLMGLNTIYSAVSNKTFDPVPAVVGVPPSASTSITRADNCLSWQQVEDARGFIVYKDNEIVGYTCSNTYYDPQLSDGTYRVRAIAANGALSPFNGEAYDLDSIAMRKVLNPTSESPVERADCYITTTVEPAEGGTAEPARIECKEGDEATIIATPADGYIFKNWTKSDGSVLTNAASYTFLVRESMDLTANFVKSQITGDVDETYVAATWDGTSVIRAEEFAAVTDAETQNATNVVDGKSILDFSISNVKVTAVGGTKPANNPDDVFDGKGEQIDSLGNVTEWIPIQWKTGRQADIDWNYIEGTGNPYVTIYGQHFSSDYPEAYRAAYTYYEPDDSRDLPITGLYYKFQPKRNGTLRVKVWVKKDRRRTFVVDEQTHAPLAYKAEGYINGQNDANGKKRILSDEDIHALHDAAMGADSEPWVIGSGSGHFWGWIIFDVEKDKSYWVFMQNAQIGFGGYDFLYGDATGIQELQGIRVSHDKDNFAIYDLMGRKVGDASTDSKQLKSGIYLKGGKKFIVK